MGLSDYQAKYYARQLQRSYATDHVGPGVILADEVGLGKTIEAAIVISQYWAERRRSILIVTPSSLRQQWKQLPAKFKIDTPVGPYNPDWAIIKHGNGQDRIYMIRETKSTLDDSKLRPSALAKIKSTKEHFKASGIVNDARAVPGSWQL